MAHKNITIDQLAQRINEGFKTTATKEDMQEFRREVADEHDRIRSDIRDIKTTLGPLVRTVAAMEREFQDLKCASAALSAKSALPNDKGTRSRTAGVSPLFGYMGSSAAWRGRSRPSPPPFRPPSPQT
jgi:hypothetical protein